MTLASRRASTARATGDPGLRGCMAPTAVTRMTARRPGGRQRTGEPGGCPVADGSEPFGEDRVKDPEWSSQPDIGRIADRGAVAIGRDHDVVDGPQQAAGRVQDGTSRPGTWAWVTL